MLFSTDVTTFLMFGLAIVVTLIVFHLYSYLCYGAGMYRIARNRGSEFAWLAWIPFVQMVMLPMMVEKNVHPLIRTRFTLIFAVSLMVSMVFGSYVYIIQMIPTLILLYGFYVLMTMYSQRAVLHLVICIVTLGVSLPLQVLLVRNNEQEVTEESF